MGDRTTCSENTTENKYTKQDVNGVVIYKYTTKYMYTLYRALLPEFIVI